MLSRLAMHRRVLMIALLTVTGVLTGVSTGFAQSDERETLIGVDIAGPLFGVYSGTFQQLLQNDLSIFVRGVYFDPKWGLVYRELVPESWTYRTVDVEIGANYYPQNSALSGFFAGVGAAPGYLFLRDHENKVVAGFRIGVVTQLGYRFVWGPIAVGPRVGMGYQWELAELEGLAEHPDIQHEQGIEGVVSGFSLGVGLDISIAL